MPLGVEEVWFIIAMGAMLMFPGKLFCFIMACKVRDRSLPRNNNLDFFFSLFRLRAGREDVRDGIGSARPGKRRPKFSGNSWQSVTHLFLPTYSEGQVSSLRLS